MVDGRPPIPPAPPPVAPALPAAPASPAAPAPPALRFVSLFVPDAAAAGRRLAALLGVESSPGAGAAPVPHPFAGGPPVTFDLGGVTLALYPCDGRTTHPGDVGLGVEVASARAAAARAAPAGVQIFGGPAGREGRALSVAVTPERHFFELVER